MPSYAVLGATGQTGRELVTILLESPDNHVNAFVRSKAKLSSMFPGILENKQVTIFEGTNQDVSLVASCISKVSAAFVVVATNDSIPGTRVAQDTANVIIAACSYIKSQDPSTALPRLLFLSSASVNPVFSKEMPRIAHEMLFNSLWYIYTDLEYAEKNLRLHRSWLDVVFIQPGGLAQAARTGHSISQEKQGGGWMAFADLAAGMIEIADSGDYSWSGVAVRPTSKDVAIPRHVPGLLLKSLMYALVPPSYRLAKFLGLA